MRRDILFFFLLTALFMTQWAFYSVFMIPINILENILEKCYGKKKVLCSFLTIDIVSL